jgi:hypothetical protein
MKRLALALALLLVASVPCFADVMPNPYVVSTMNRCSGTIASGGTSQTAISSSQNGGSKFWIISNPPSATETLYVDFGQAAGTTSLPLQAGQSVSFGGQAIWQGLVTVYGATTSHAYTCFYGQ